MFNSDVFLLLNRFDPSIPLFKYLTQAPNPDFTGDIDWNFSKFLIDENRKLIHRYRSSLNRLTHQLPATYNFVAVIKLLVE